MSTPLLTQSSWIRGQGDDGTYTPNDGRYRYEIAPDSSISLFDGDGFIRKYVREVAEVRAGETSGRDRRGWRHSLSSREFSCLKGHSKAKERTPGFVQQTQERKNKPKKIVSTEPTTTAVSLKAFIWAL